MKKLTKVAVLVMALCLLFTGCNQSSDPANEPNDHVHDWQDATCVSPQTCACGETQGDPLGHTEVAVPAKEATCTEDGMGEGTACSTCGLVLTAPEVFPAKGHQLENNICTICNEEFIDLYYAFNFDKLVFSDVGTKNLNGIDWTLDADWVNKDDPSRYGETFKAPAADNPDKLARGQQFGSASMSSHIDSMTLSSTAFTNVTKIKLRTCGVAGFEGTLTVSVGDTVVGTYTLGTDYKGIDYHYEIDVPNLSGKIVLSYSQPDTEKAFFIGSICVAHSGLASAGDTHTHTAGVNATCTSAQTCIVCGIEMAPAKAHTPGAKATCSAPQICTVCKGVVTPAKAHTPGAKATCTTAQTCTVCSAKLVSAKGHQLVNDTCIVCDAKLGSATSYVFNFDHKVFSDVGSKNLNGITWNLDASWTNKGDTSRYGETFKAPAADNPDKLARGQQFGSASKSAHIDRMTLSSTALTNVTKIKLRTCGVAGFEGTLTVSVGGTVVGSYTLGTEYKGINYHYEIDVPNLSGEIVLSYSQPSTEKAFFIGSIYIDYVEMVAGEGTHTHIPGEEATCTTAQICTVCNFEVAPAKGHTPGAEATCTAAQTCTVCNEELAPANGHNFVDGICTVCNAEESNIYTFNFDYLVYSDVGTQNLNGIDWTLDADWANKGDASLNSSTFKAPATAESSYAKNVRGQQFSSGSKSAHINWMTLTSTALNDVTKIKIRTCGASGFVGTVTVTVGGTEVGTYTLGTTYGEEGYDYDFYNFEIDVANLSGVVEFRFDQPETMKAFYVGGIYIEYAKDDSAEEEHTHTPGAEATCTAAQICTVCNEELAPAKGHTPGAEATCTAAQICTVCNEELVAAKGHNFVDGICTVCNAEEPSVETYTFNFDHLVFSGVGAQNLNGIDWTLDADWGNKGNDSKNGETFKAPATAESNYAKNVRGQQFSSGSQSAHINWMTLTSTALNDVTKIKIRTCGASGFVGTVTVTVGGVEVGTYTLGTTYGEEGYDYDFYNFEIDVANLSGVVEFRFDQPETMKAFYVGGICIEYAK